MKNETYKKVITKSERFQLIGLVELGRQAYAQMKQVDKALRAVIKMKGGYSSGAGLISEIYFDDTPNVDECLENMGIKVK